MKIENICTYNSVVCQYLAEMRDIEVQKDSLRFRKNMERIGTIMAYEISKTMHYNKRTIQTPLGVSEVPTINNHPVLASILRAGLPMHQGMLEIFDKAENAFISAYRAYEADGSFTIKFEHISTPTLDNKIVIVSDPMLATGSSMVLACKALLKNGTPEQIHIATIIASKEGVEYLSENLKYENTTLWVAAIDDELTSKSYIVPGLGDAGDLAFGSKR